MNLAHTTIVFLFAGVLCLPGTATFGQAPNPPKASEPERQDNTDAILDQLLEDYRSYGLPFPPDEAPLVRINAGGSIKMPGEAARPFIYLGFPLDPDPENKYPIVLLGPLEVARWNRTRMTRVTQPTPQAANNISTCLSEPFPMKVGIATAVQCKARGWDQLAEALLDRTMISSCGFGYSALADEGDVSTRTELAAMAWTYWRTMLMEPSVHANEVARRLRKLLTANKELNWERNLEFLRDLEATLRPTGAEQGSIEAMIDDLVNVTWRGPIGGLFPPEYSMMEFRSDERYAKLRSQGLDVVLHLLKHLDDNRMTRSVGTTYKLRELKSLRVKDIALVLLQDIADGELGKSPFFLYYGDLKGDAAARAWWDATREAGGEK